MQHGAFLQEWDYVHIFLSSILKDRENLHTNPSSLALDVNVPVNSTASMDIELEVVTTPPVINRVPDVTPPPCYGLLLDVDDAVNSAATMYFEVLFFTGICWVLLLWQPKASWQATVKRPPKITPAG
ncbi:hypothetical protein JTE90_021149 [Oedothorax gibbosus]|uniref:Uncharacterized protein n=1 Tax=Oedothorax gibbosus TaxID=931172 RepID=A0AAV6U1C8_9ARAC|nr:hypothetical protein JTE90_021149 [Oedothorax gibbosus]